MVKRVLLSRQLADELCRQISTGRYVPGDRLPPIQEMAGEFGVSVSSLREAIRSLEIAGILAVRHGKGVYVSERVSLNDDCVSTLLAINSLKLKTVYEARLIVEVGAIPLVVERATDDDIDHLRRIVGQVTMASHPDELSRADIELHMALIGAARNPLLTEMLQPLVQAISHDIRFIHSLDRVLGEFLAWHRRILDALEARDVARCQEMPSNHLQRGLAILTSEEPST